MNDSKPLFSNPHKKTSDEWDFKIPYIGRLNKVLDWIWFKIHRPKFTESNLDTHWAYWRPNYPNKIKEAVDSIFKKL